MTISRAIFCYGMLAAAPAISQTPTMQPLPTAEVPAIAALIDDLDSGNSVRAVKRISSIESISGRPKLVTTSAEFVERMKGCKVSKRQPRPSPPQAIYQFESSDWTCPAGPARVVFGAVGNEPYVTIAEYSDTERIQATVRVAPPPIILPAPPPLPLTAEEQAANLARNAKLRDAFGKSVMAGNLDGIREVVTPSTRFSYEFHAPGIKTTFLEKEGFGFEAGRQQIQYSREQLGTPSNFECKYEGTESCVWHFASGDRVLLGFPSFTRDGHLMSVSFMYATRQKVLEAQKASQELSNR